MKKYKLVVCITLTVLCCTALFVPVSASADTGPKPSVQIKFVNMGAEICYATLLSHEANSGPYFAWDGDDENADPYELGEIWHAFAEYKDRDGYYFLQWAKRCDETQKFSWTYYPPQKFKILLYYPELDAFVSSGVCKRYAFDSYFTVNMQGITVGSVDQTLTPKKSYNYGWEIFTLVLRIVITILIEIGLAWLFRMRERKVFLTILFTNVATQVLLNVALNVINYYMGALMWLIMYFLLELAVFVVEFVVYALVFPRVANAKIPCWKTLLYTLAANVTSFVLGGLLALVIPAIF